MCWGDINQERQARLQVHSMLLFEFIINADMQQEEFDLLQEQQRRHLSAALRRTLLLSFAAACSA